MEIDARSLTSHEKSMKPIPDPQHDKDSTEDATNHTSVHQRTNRPHEKSDPRATRKRGGAEMSQTPATSNRRGQRRLRKPLLGLLGILTFLGLWEVLPALGGVNPVYLPPASDAVADLGAKLVDVTFWQAVGDTMLAWSIGLLVAVVLAVAIGFPVGYNGTLRRYTHSTVEFLRPIPSVALIPLAVLLFGMQLESSLMLIIYACFWQVFIQVIYGVSDVDSIAMQTAKSYGLGTFARMRHVVFPTTLPFLMTGIRLGAAVALIIAITAELVIGSPGLGREIAFAQSAGQFTSMYSLILATGLLGVIINVFVRRLERVVLSWHTSVRTEENA